MGPFVVAWLIGESIVAYRWARLKTPPPPGALALSSAVFAGLAVIAGYQPARAAATVAAYGYDLAILLQVIGKAPSGVTGWPPPLIDDPSVLLPTGRAHGGPGGGGAGNPGAPLTPQVSIVPPSGLNGSCPDGYTFFGGQCYKCPDGYAFSNGRCVPGGGGSAPPGSKIGQGR